MGGGGERKHRLGEPARLWRRREEEEEEESLGGGLLHTCMHTHTRAHTQNSLLNTFSLLSNSAYTLGTKT